MSLKWTVYIALKPQRGLKNTKLLCTSLEESLLQSFFLCEYCQRQSCTAIHWPIYPYKNGSWLWLILFSIKIWPKLTHRFKNTDFQSVFGGSQREPRWTNVSLLLLEVKYLGPRGWLPPCLIGSHICWYSYILAKTDTHSSSVVSETAKFLVMLWHKC